MNSDPGARRNMASTAERVKTSVRNNAINPVSTTA